MSHRNQTLFVAMALAFCAMLGASACAEVQAQAKPTANAKAQKKFFCWNENGRKVCGDALPPAAANAARTEISAKSGLATGQVARAQTESERAEAAVSAAAAQKQADAEAIQKRRDLAMVESYMTEADLRRAYGERTSLLDETLKASQLGLSNLRLSLITLLRQAGDAELDKTPVPKRLANSILQQHIDLIRQQRMLVDQRRDRAALDAELADAVRRYRELKLSNADSAAPPPPG